ncbi:MAG: hypothetical protein JWO26_1225 [Rhodospirillales bacterium]|jgi:hypothetical protein|nr:hypothetical protein [Rhodospirillales bacterium]
MPTINTRAELERLMEAAREARSAELLVRWNAMRTALLRALRWAKPEHTA